MPNDERELIELAAKAAGYQLDGLASLRIVQGVGADDYLRINEKGGHSVWNPLTSDGDALRLAVKLGMEVSVAFAQVYACRFGLDDGREVNEPFGEAHGPDAPDRYAAARRAIVRAAASIGERGLTC